jgi:dipeptidyl aminopeptidase/acylaminoacyl peptidase
VAIDNKSSKWECLTKDNKAADSGPKFSPDGKRLAWRAQKTAGYEADKWDIVSADCKEDGSLKEIPQFSITAADQRSVNEFVWASVWSRGQIRYGYVFATDYQGSSPLMAITAQQGGDMFFVGNARQGRKDGPVGVHSSLSASATGEDFAYSVARLNAPAEIYANTVARSSPESPNLSRANDSLLAGLDLPRPMSVDVPVEGNAQFKKANGENAQRMMQMWVLKPPGFDPAKKWPVVYLVHGGPQGAWEDSWSFRWNPQVWAAQGYVIAMPNPRGSTGFGQQYVDEISGDWGGKCYVDLMAGLAYLEKQPWIDSERMGAAGASFGGYMMNWFAVNTGKFKTLITHCGVWNFDSMYTTTEELWFDEWEHGGPPWGKNRDSYEKYSPHKFAANLAKYKTPMLIIHNDLDFRVPISEGTQLFTSLQRQGIPSRFINFPDEGHWVLRPRNSEYWHREVFGWLKKHVPSGPR